MNNKFIAKLKCTTGNTSTCKQQPATIKHTTSDEMMNQAGEFFGRFKPSAQENEARNSNNNTKTGTSEIDSNINSSYRRDTKECLH
jgi:hypothetical protein